MIRESGSWSMVAADGRDVFLGSSAPKKAFDGYSETQGSASGVRRALLARFLVDERERARVVIDRRELGRLFERRQDDIAWDIFSPRLQVRDSLESVIEYLEAEMAKAGAKPMRERGRGSHTCWFTTPGVDFDVVFQTLQRARNHHFVGMVFGPWPHGSAVYALETAMWPRGLRLFRELSRGIPAMTEEEAFRVLTSCRIDLPVPVGGDGSTQGGV